MSLKCPIDLHRIFDKLDQNRDGLIFLDELMCPLEKIGLESSLEELELLVGKQHIDPIDFWFFHENIIKERVDGSQKGVMENELLKVFRVFDSDGDGFISCEELQKALFKMGLWDKKCGKDCKSMIQHFDTNFDGKIDFQEFKEMMNH